MMKAGMLGSPRVRSGLDVDNPIDADGFYRYWRMRASRAGRPTTGKFRRRVLRAKEDRAWRRDVRDNG